jgi:hypothetical protein
MRGAQTRTGARTCFASRSAIQTIAEESRPASMRETGDATDPKKASSSANVAGRNRMAT